MIDWILNVFNDRSFGSVRSPMWSSVQKAFVSLHPTCAVCGSKGKLLNPLNVHHIRPFYLHPDDELNVENLITLCRDHHFLFGHLNSWSSFNADVVRDSETILTKINTRP